MKYLIGAAALAMSTAALAQTTTTTSAPASAPATATPAGPATAPAQSTTDSTTTTSATTAPADAAAQTTATAQAAPAADPKAVLTQQFPTYDKDGNGTLSQTEFAAWLTEMKTAQNSEKLTPEQISKWANDSFGKADKDKSKSVTVAELQGFLVPNA